MEEEWTCESCGAFLSCNCTEAPDGYEAALDALELWTRERTNANSMGWRHASTEHFAVLVQAGRMEWMDDDRCCARFTDFVEWSLRDPLLDEDGIEAVLDAMGDAVGRPLVETTRSAVRVKLKDLKAPKC